nr:DUF3375 family protein [Aggregatilineales bacterium]
MDFDTIARLHKTDPALLALRRDWLPLAVSFLHYAFKQKHEVQLGHDLFRERLDAYLEHVNAGLAEDARFRHDADHYINVWSRDADLIRIRNREDGHVVMLSPYAERLLGWFEDMQFRGVVGTESRLRNILLLLDEVVTSSTEDVEKRLQQLVERRDQIDSEILRIEQTQQVDGLSDVQIRERLEHLGQMVAQLLRDFSLVEERFREMALSIQQALLDPAANRGDILGTVLDADERLESSDEGQSFRAFYELLTRPEERETFDGLIDAVYSTPRLSPFVADNRMLQRLTSHLLDAGERVNQSNRYLAEHLRRVVDTRNLIESRRVQTLAGEIKYGISQLGDTVGDLLGSRRSFHAIEGDPGVELPLERPLFDPPDQATLIDRPRPAPAIITAEALMPLFDTAYIDFTALQENIARMLLSRQEFTLVELVRSYPVTSGVAELIAYLQLAARAEQHSIDRAQTDQVSIQTRAGDQRLVEMPRVIFRRPHLTTEADHV